MTCCIGKARIYFKEPLGFKFRYKLSGGNWQEIIKNEPLMSICVQQSPGQQSIQYNVWYKIRSIAREGMAWEESQEYYAGILTGAIGTIIEYGYNYGNYYLIRHGITHANNQNTNAINYAWSLTYSLRIEAVNPEEEQPIYTFKVIGADTGAEYLNVGNLPECPEVENLGCVMGEEKYIDVDMGIGLPLLPSMIPDCLIAFSGFPLPENTIQIRKVRVPDAIPNTKPGKKVKLPQTVLTITGLPGCPAEYRIECCPDGECDPPKCPPDTDCELDCGDFICCYKNGKVIRTIQKT